METEDSCLDHVHDAKSRVMDFLRNHERFVRFLGEKDLPKKCAKKYLTAAGGKRSGNLFEGGACDLSFKFALKLDAPFSAGLDDVIADALPSGIKLEKVTTTKMNCMDGGKRGKGDKAAKKSSKAGGKPGKK